MTRLFIICCLTIAVFATSPVRADVTFEKGGGSDDKVDVIRLTVTPATEPVPPLRHRLLARDVDLKTGNAVPYYYRAQLNLHSTMKSIRDKYDDEKELGMWTGTGEEATPIAKLPLDKVRDANKMFDPIYNQHLRPAFERSDCDWELGIDEMRGVVMVEFLLPEFQDNRDIARMLALRTRLAIAERRYDDAIETMLQLYRLGHDTAKVPFIVCGLIGTAIDGITNGTILELIANRDSPNMYWALTELPQPAINLQSAVRFEMDFGPRMFPFIDHAETAEHAPQEWNRLFVQAIRDFGKLSGAWSPSSSNDKPDPLLDIKAGVGATGLALVGYTHAKEWLIAQGMDRERIEAMPVGQVMAIYTGRIYRRYSDDCEKMWYVPFGEMVQQQAAADRRLEQANPFSGAADREMFPMLSVLLPAIQNVRMTQIRMERQVAALRIIEALRMYAATNDGHLPAALDDIKQVPVPLNPATSKPFVYHLEGAKGLLELPASDHITGGNCRYEIQIDTSAK